MKVEWFNAILHSGMNYEDCCDLDFCAYFILIDVGMSSNLSCRYFYLACPAADLT